MTADFEEKHQWALAELARTTMKPRYCCPPLHRLMWRLGFKVRPPHYTSSLNVVMTISTLFTLIWGTLLSALGINGGLLLVNYLYSAMAGMVLGVLLAAYYRYGKAKHGLTPWDQLTRDQLSAPDDEVIF